MGKICEGMEGIIAVGIERILDAVAVGDGTAD